MAAQRSQAAAAKPEPAAAALRQKAPAAAMAAAAPGPGQEQLHHSLARSGQSGHIRDVLQAVSEHGCKVMYAGFPQSFGKGWMMGMFQLSGVYCIGAQEAITKQGPQERYNRGTLGGL